MSATSIMQGDIFVNGKVHGQALNCTVVPYDFPEKWYMVQFVSQMQMDQYAREHNLVTRRSDEDAHDIGR